MRRNAVLLFALFLALQVSGLAQSTTGGAPRKIEYYALEDVRTGQKGIGAHGLRRG